MFPPNIFSIPNFVGSNPSLAASKPMLFGSKPIRCANSPCIFTIRSKTSIIGCDALEAAAPMSRTAAVAASTALPCSLAIVCVTAALLSAAAFAAFGALFSVMISSLAAARRQPREPSPHVATQHKLVKVYCAVQQCLARDHPAVGSGSADRRRGTNRPIFRAVRSNFARPLSSSASVLPCSASSSSSQVRKTRR